MVANRYDYTAFGSAAPAGIHAAGHEAQQTVDQRYTYTGREATQDPSIMYYRWRMYAPGTGRFGRRDPILYLGSPDGNLYNYVFSRPTYMIDPYGEGCQIYFNCTLLKHKDDEDTCTYFCEEREGHSRTTIPFGGDTDCADVPSKTQTFLEDREEIDGGLFGDDCCPDDYSTVRWYSNISVKQDCSRRSCRKACEAVYLAAKVAAKKIPNPIARKAAKEAAEKSRDLCRATCNAVCKNP
jgi:RHS repeat-associated protein